MFGDPQYKYYMYLETSNASFIYVWRLQIEVLSISRVSFIPNTNDLFFIKSSIRRNLQWRQTLNIQPAKSTPNMVSKKCLEYRKQEQKFLQITQTKITPNTVNKKYYVYIKHAPNKGFILRLLTNITLRLIHCLYLE